MRAIDSVVPIKQVKAKANFKHWFNNFCNANKKQNIYRRHKNPGLETNKDEFKTKLQNHFFKRC